MSEEGRSINENADLSSDEEELTPNKTKKTDHKNNYNEDPEVFG